MIIVDPNSDKRNKHHGPCIFEIGELLTRTAAELAHVTLLGKELEGVILRLSDGTSDGKARETMQSIDLMQQSISALSQFLTGAAQRVDGPPIDVTDLIASIKLGEMRHRLTGYDAPL